MKKNRINIEKIVKIIGYICIIITMVIVMFSLPDLILLFRRCILKIPIWNLFLDKSIDDVQYIEMILTITTCLITAILSIIAYRLSKEIGKLNIAGKKAKDAYAAYCLGEYIKRNSRIVYNTKKTVGNLHDLKYSEDAFEHWTVVRALNVFTNEQKMFFPKYNNMIRQIESAYEENQQKEMENKVDLFCNNYLNLLEDDFGYNDETNEILVILKKISDGGIN